MGFTDLRIMALKFKDKRIMALKCKDLRLFKDNLTK